MIFNNIKYKIIIFDNYSIENLYKLSFDFLMNNTRKLKENINKYIFPWINISLI